MAGIRLRLGEVELYHRRPHSAAGTVVLLVHGWGCDHTVWGPMLAVAGDEIAGAEIDSVVVDLRGHGRSGRAATPHTIGAMARDLEELLETLDLRSVVAVGHSMGGNVVVELGVRRPDLVRAVVAVDPAYGDPGWADAENRAAELAKRGSAAPLETLPAAFHPGSDPALIDPVAAALRDTDHQVLIEALRSTYTDPDAFGHLPDTRRRLAQLQVPLLSLYADPAAAARAETFPISHQVTVIPHTGHFIPVEQPERLWDSIRSWLAGVSAA